MAGDANEELISAGSERAALLGARLRRHRGRWLIVLLALAAVTLTALALRPQRPDAHRAEPPRPTAPAPATSSAEVHYDYLIEVPAADMAAAVSGPLCRSGCTARSLAGSTLRRAAASFAGLRLLAGGTVSDPAGRVLVQSVEALAAPDVVVHLLVQRAASAAARVMVSTRDEDGSRIVTLSRVRAGWRLTATMASPSTEPPVAAARTWSATTTLPG